MPKANPVLLAITFSELFLLVVANQENLSITATPSPISSPSHLLYEDNLKNHSFTLAELLGICAGLLVGVPLVLVALVYLVEYCQNKFYSSDTNSVHSDPEASIETRVPKNHMIENLDYDFALNGNDTSQDGAHV